MMFVEVFVPAGRLDPDQRLVLASRMVAELNEEADAPDSVLDGARQLTQVVVHEPTVWVVGDETSDHASRYLVRVTMPGAWNNKDMGGYLIPRITSALAAVDPDPDRLYREPRAWVQLVGLKEGSLGASGQVMTITDITRLITKDYRESGEPVATAAPGTAIDPTCGMTVSLDDDAITAELDGVTYGFCAAVCRKVFVEEYAEAS